MAVNHSFAFVNLGKMRNISRKFSLGNLVRCLKNDRENSRACSQVHVYFYQSRSQPHIYAYLKGEPIGVKRASGNHRSQTIFRIESPTSVVAISKRGELSTKGTIRHRLGTSKPQFQCA